VPDVGEFYAGPAEDLRASALALAHEGEQDVLGPDVVMAEVPRLPRRELEHGLGPGRERDVPGRRSQRAAAGHLLDLRAGGVELDAESLQGLSRDTGPLADEAHQDVLGANVGVAEVPGFFPGEHDDLPGPVCVALEHRSVPDMAVTG
jgi:hypothetical protein